MISLFLSVALASELGSSRQSKPVADATISEARDLTAFAREMQIDPAFKPVSFIRTSDSGDLQMNMVKYTCRGGLSVTLLPMIHFAEKSYFQAVDSVSTEALFTEGLRPNGFFGPPFEKDNRLQTRAQLFDRTRDRLESLSLAVATYRKSHAGHAPHSLYDVAPSWSQAKVDRMFVDTWGKPFKLSVLPGDLVQISSGGDDGQSPVSIVNTNDVRVDGSPTMNDKMQATANEQDLVFETKFPWNEKSTQRSADVTIEMLKDPVRNVAPMLALDDLLTSNAYHPTSIAIRYGAEHMPKFEQYLEGGKYGCKRESGKWQTAVTSPVNAKGLSPAQVRLRWDIIGRVSEMPATLDAKP